MTARDDVLATLDREWRSSREIWQRIGCWSEIIVSVRLNELAESGEIERGKESRRGGFRWLYRRTEAA
jgi:hypothetical protein